MGERWKNMEKGQNQTGVTRTLMENINNNQIIKRFELLHFNIDLFALLFIIAALFNQRE